MNNKDNRTNGLREHTSRKKAETEAKVYQTIDYMLNNGIKEINFQTVSKMSGISRTTLYNNERIRKKIESLRVPSDDVSKEELEQTKKEILKLKQELQKLMRENQLMADQLVEMDDIKRENKRLKEQLNTRL